MIYDRVVLNALCCRATTLAAQEYWIVQTLQGSDAHNLRCFTRTRRGFLSPPALDAVLRYGCIRRR